MLGKGGSGSRVETGIVPIFGMDRDVEAGISQKAEECPRGDRGVSVRTG